MNHKILLSFIALDAILTIGAATAQEPVCPLGDGWKFAPEFSDEFNQDKLDAEKWFDTNPGWPGRKPAKFCKENVYLKDGKLCLRAILRRNRCNSKHG